MRKADYKWISEEYDSARPMSRSNLDCWMTLISQRIGPRRNVELLDLGCGTGRFSIPMATRLRYTVVGADSSGEMLQKAQEKDSSTEVKWDLQDAAHLSYPDHSFDVVFMSHLLHHVDEPLRVVRECCRILRAGGVILNRYGAIEHIRDDPEHGFFPAIIGIDEIRTPTVGHVEDWFGMAGFKDVSSETIVFKVEEGAIQRYAQAIGDPNPLYNDPDFASKTKHGRLLAPPGFTGWPVKAGRPAEKVFELLVKAGAPPRVLDGGVEFEFIEPIGAGDTLAATPRIAGITERETRLGKAMFTTIETAFVNREGNVAVKSRSTLIQF